MSEEEVARGDRARDDTRSRCVFCERFAFLIVNLGVLSMRGDAQFTPKFNQARQTETEELVTEMPSKFWSLRVCYAIIVLRIANTVHVRFFDKLH